MDNQLALLNDHDKKILISTFIGKNRSQEIFDWQQKVFKHFNIPHNYVYVPFETGYPYGHAINQFINQTLEYVDYYIFMDVDAIPLRKNSVELIIKRIEDGESIWGISQQSAHILKHGSPIHVYAGFSCCAFSKEIYLKCGRPTFSETSLGDIGEQLSREVKFRGFNLCLSYPNEFHELTDKEMSDTGNPRHGWVDNKYGMGLGSSFGNNLVYHSFHTDCHKGTNNLRIPRAAELFIKKAKIAMSLDRKKRNLEMITSCVNSEYKYSDFLKITLPFNKKHFDNILVVTTEKDTETQSVCKENGVDFFCTDAFFANGSRFDPNNATNSALHKLKYKDWLVSASPDIIYQDDFRQKLELEELDSNVMYGTSRLFINTSKDWLDYLTSKRELSSFLEIPGWGCGFTQIFDLKSNKLKGIPLEQTFPSNGQSIESDIWMLRRFHPDVRDVGKLPITVIHLGHKDFGGAIRDKNGESIKFFFDDYER